jgi:hypothetical protein
MVRARVRAAVRLLAVLSVPIMLLAAPLPASAAGRHMCETYGSYCVGSDNLSLYTAVTEKPESTGGGRNLIDTPLGGHFDGFPTYLLQFADDATKCVASDNAAIEVVIHPCNGGTGVIWARDITNGHLRWLNVYAAPMGFLEGYNNGTQYGLGFADDGYQKAFDWQ